LVPPGNEGLATTTWPCPCTSRISAAATPPRAAESCTVSGVLNPMKRGTGATSARTRGTDWRHARKAIPAAMRRAGTAMRTSQSFDPERATAP
jgi:hypothetical protein